MKLRDSDLLPLGTPVEIRRHDGGHGLRIQEAAVERTRMERRTHDADLDDALLKFLDQLIRVGIVNLEMNLAVFPMKRLHPRAEQDAAG